MFPIIPANSAAADSGNQEGIFGYGATTPNITFVSTTNLVSNVGVVGTDVAGVGTVRTAIAATQYGGDKGVFGYGRHGATVYSITNLVSNVGVVATDVAGVGSARGFPMACSFN